MMTQLNLNMRDILNARKQLTNYIRKTPVESSKHFGEQLKGEIYLKLENQQVTGSFKIRGVLNKLLSLSEEELEKGCLCASSGNHGIALAYASKLVGTKAKIVVPEGTPTTKIRKLKRYGGEVTVEGETYDDAEKKAKEIEERENLTFVSSYNDLKVIAGQGTIGLEVLEEVPQIDTFVTPIGGGSLISGIAVAAKTIDPDIRVIGVQSAASPFMYESLKVGRILDLEEVNFQPSIATAIYGGVEEGSVTFDFIQKYVDEILLVEEEEIKDTVKELIQFHTIFAEPASAAGVATLKRHHDIFKSHKSVFVISGGNIGYELLKNLLSK